MRTKGNPTRELWFIIHYNPDNLTHTAGEAHWFPIITLHHQSTPWLAMWFVDLSNKLFLRIIQQRNFEGFSIKGFLKDYPSKNFKGNILRQIFSKHIFKNQVYRLLPKEIKVFHDFVKKYPGRA